MTSLLERRGWIVVLLVAFGLYAWSFNSFPALERQKWFLGDAANYKILLERWSLREKIGNEYATDPRRLEDVAQKHKVHHVLFGILGRPVYLGARAVYQAVGWNPAKAAYAVNALIGVLTLVLLRAYLMRLNPQGNPLLPFLVLQAFSLSTWMLSSGPGSWPLTGALMLLTLYLAERRALPLPALAALLGVFMLNNMTLGLVVIPLSLRLLTADGPLVRRLAGAAGLGAIAGAVWLTGLLLLSLLDDSFRPDHFLAYSAWFKEYLGESLPITSLYVWKSILSNLFVTTIASNQGDLRIPPEAVLYTLRGSVVGAIATVAVVALLSAGAWRMVRGLLARRRQEGLRTTLRDEPAVPIAIQILLQVVMTAALSYTSGWYYGPTMVPLVVLMLCRYLDLRDRRMAVFVYTAVALIVINNAVQIDRFRDVLRAMP
jgi:hypothetical protein